MHGPWDEAISHTVKLAYGGVGHVQELFSFVFWMTLTLENLKS